MLNVGSLFSGAGLLDCGLAQTGGFRHEWFCEADEFRRGLLARRFPGALILDDIRTLTADVVPRVDVLAGGFPCRGVSTAGKRDGFDNDQTVLWHEMARAVRELQPRYVLIENVAAILSMAASPSEPPGSLWGTVLGDLAEIGYLRLEWECLPAGAVGAPHLRDRLFAIAQHAEGAGGQGARSGRQALGGAETADPLPATDTAGAQSRRDAGQFGVGGGRQDDRGGDRAATEAVADAERIRQQGRPTVREGRSEVERRSSPPADTERDGVRQQPVPERRGSGARVATTAGQDAADAAGGPEGRDGPQATGGLATELDGDGAAAADASEGRRGASERHLRERQPDAEGCLVEWGEYEPAIRRWESVHGPAPAPLTGVRGVDAGDAKLSRLRARLDRQRLSALGDGVHVYVARLAGERILELEEQRLMAASVSYRRSAA